MGPYIRVKRQNQTVFLDVQPTESFRSVKEKIGVLFHLPPTSIQLWDGLNEKESKEFADGATLADHEVQNDAVVYMCWKKEKLSVAKVEAVDAGDSSRSTGGSGSGGIGANFVS
uniref:Ubiquitin-like domain-containing protein n=1 Tax=Hyaloperonospora arabidopsidis (strain Emoy2) TaxID=559515 RepID=M4B9F2_HYAAE